MRIITSFHVQTRFYNTELEYTEIVIYLFLLFALLTCVILRSNVHMENTEGLSGICVNIRNVIA